MNNPVKSAIKKSSAHPSIIKQVSNQLMEAGIFKLNSSKATTLNSIPVKILKLIALACSDAFSSIYNNLVSNGQFPGELKMQILPLLSSVMTD